MKILIDARLYGLENAGLGRYVMNLVEELARIDKKNKYSVLLGKKYYDLLSFPSNWKKILTDFRHYSFAEQIRLPRIVANEKPDLVHFPHFNIPVFFKGKFVVTIHDLLMHRQRGFAATTLSPVSYLVKRLGYRLAFDRAVFGSAKIIVPSVSVKSDLINFYKVSSGKVSVTYEGFDQKIVNIENGNAVLDKYKISRKYFIYTGNAYPHKNLERAIEAIISLNKGRSEKVDLVIVSARNVFVKRLDKMVHEAGAGDYVKLLGFVPDDGLGILYKESLAFLFPSISEGFGLPGLEAMSSGTLVLASDIPVFREVYKENAIYFNPLDFSAIQKAMLTACGMNSTERLRRINTGREFSKYYSWSKMAEETLKIYESCVGL
jgi:glycosyltransferase involved in cell wall biosynthesis